MSGPGPRVAPPLGPPSSVVGVIPAYNEAANIERAVEMLARVPEVDRVVVVDGDSTDGTPEVAERAGARVITQDPVAYPGKGYAIQTAIRKTDEDALVFFDADIHNMEPWMPRKLVRPLLDGGVHHACATYGRKGGRVTELTARPLLDLFFPEVDRKQPLCGEFATRREVISSIDLVPDWGIESGLAIDLAMGGFRLEEVDIGYKEHDMKPLAELKVMASQVVRTILAKAIEYERYQQLLDQPMAPAAWEAPLPV